MRHSYVAHMSQIAHINDDDDEAIIRSTMSHVAHMNNDDNEAFIRCTHESRRTYE